MKCKDCQVELTDKNYAEGDKLAHYCKICWGKNPYWEPTCSVCGVHLIQSEDLWTVYCPISKNHPVLTLVEQIDV